MKTLNIMLKPASSLCNMRCKYCFYADVADSREVHSYGIMSDATAKRLLDTLALEFGDGDRVQIIFQGGEPTLAGLDFFKNFVKAVKEKLHATVVYAMQTNGLHIDDAWCAFLKENGFLVGLSLDLLPDTHDGARVDANLEGTYKRVVRAIERLKHHGVDFNVLCTLTNAVARYPNKVYSQLSKLGVDYVQFTPCLGELDGSRSDFALTPERFASFYTSLFELWYNDYRAGKYRSIKLFDDVVNQMILGRPTLCGMDGKCQAQLVIEADGSAYPCDFYCLDEFRLGNLTEQSVSELMKSDALNAFLTRTHEMPSFCGACNYRAFCGGNCKRMQKEICCAHDDGFCGYQNFLDKCGGRLSALANEQMKAYGMNRLNIFDI